MKKKDFRAERKQHRIEENKKFILQAAEKIFAQRGFGLATMDDIAEEAQFSKATLYRYYKSKGEIFFEIIYKSVEEVLHKTKKIKKGKISSEKKLRELIYYVSSYYHKKKNISRIFIMEKSAMRKILNLDSKEQFMHSSKHPPIPAVFKAKMEGIFNIMCEIIKEGIKSGEFRNVDIRNASFILGAMIRGFHFRGPLRDKEFSLEESTELLHSFFLYGIKKDRKA
ncbi:MAG: TetR/AcrR family transcriptional regulator [Candidatus Aminicenantes bacterium]|nr:TetR/AcrR family transcriptional regulator [Candidatus Aminicenantes bacterium]